VVTTNAEGLVLGYKDAGSGNYEIRATLFGDTDLDGRVNVADLGNLAANFGQTIGMLWINGDFDYNGNVNVADLGDLAANFGNVLAGGSGSAAVPAAVVSDALVATAVPEPSSFVCLALGAI